ncbi:MAG: ATP-binding cassette domain-containing protein [Candidatus Bipolaricaulota bacterium]|nr:ATP-binding cassette domain-containing protein [Candidatus Bipolaricaulota bacterium]
MDRTALRVQGIVKDFDGLRAVDGISLEASRGEILGFLGPNGAGKTTSIRIILGIFEPDEGEISIRIGGLTGRLLKERTGYLPEERGLYSDATVLDALVYFAELKGLRRADARQRVLRWLGRFDLVPWANKKVEKLSKGMQQKVQFIAAVAHEPDLLVLDEPFSGLDPLHQDLLKDVIRELRDAGAAILLSAHQMNQVEELCDRVFLINRGRQVFYGTLDEIKSRDGEHVVRLRFEGSAESLAALPGVESLAVRGDRASLRLGRGASPDAFVRSLPVALTVLELSVTRPPLHDIFVRAIEKENHEAA